jgi:hypothetical protein
LKRKNTGRAGGTIYITSLVPWKGESGQKILGTKAKEKEKEKGDEV